MILYVILISLAVCLGMGISVWAFGTGGKRSKIFQDIYFTVEETDDMGIVYTKTGELSAVIRMENPVAKYGGNIEHYYEYNKLFTSICATLGEGYAIHKQDILTRKGFADLSTDKREFLSDSYFEYFKGREYVDSFTYLTITQECRKSRILSYDPKKWKDFLVKIRKVSDMLRDANIRSEFLNKSEVTDFVDRFFTMDFVSDRISFNSFKAGEEYVGMGDRNCKTYSLVDVDCINLPTRIRPYTQIEVNNTSLPVDLMHVLDSIPEVESVVYNQMIFMPGQRRELSLLDKKRNRHASVPNPGNQIAVEDIEKVQEVVARENKQLVYAHFNIMVICGKEVDLHKPTNHLENVFGRLGIHISKKNYNQLELFVNSFPGNCFKMNPEYDRFLTIADAATCLMYKEYSQHSEQTPLKIYYTDRQGVPVAIDISGKEGSVKMTDNSNFFCLGPSGSGKSFHMHVIWTKTHRKELQTKLRETS